MAIEVDIHADTALMQALDNLSPGSVSRAVVRASKRAATAARLAGTKQIHEVYTIRSADLKGRTRIQSVSDGTVIQIRGPVESVKKYRSRKRAHGIFVSVKKGSGAVLARSFDMRGWFVAREGKARFPIHDLYGPSVPSLFGNETVMDAVEKRGSAVFGERLEHEIGRLIEGGK